MSDPDAAPSSDPVLITMPPYGEVTPRGMISGGWILSQIDVAVGLAGARIAGGDVLIVKISALVFLGPLHAGEAFTMHLDPTRFGSSSVTVDLSAFAGSGPDLRTILNAKVILVAVDEDGRPRKIDKSE